MSYRVPLDRLRALKDKRIIQNQYYDHTKGCGCIVTLVAPSTKALTGELTTTSIESLFPLADEDQPTEVATVRTIFEELEEAGVSFEEARLMQGVCDKYEGTDEARAEHMETWLEARVAKEKAI